jgi:multidrug resistance protein, MATE family
VPNLPHWSLSAWKGEFRETIRLGLPMALTQLGIIVVNTTDVLMIGRLGPQALASASLGHGFWVTLFLFGVGVVSAVPPLAAQALGARKPRTMRQVARHGIWVALAVGILASALMAFAQPILVALGQEPANAAGADFYLKALLWSTTPALCFIALRGYISAFGVVRPMLLIMLAAIPLNALLNWILIFGNLGAPRLELLGAGIASSIVHTFTFAALVVYVTRARRFRHKAVFARFWRFQWARFLEIVRLGLPIGILLILEVGLFMAAAVTIGLIGTLELAAHQIALQLASISFMVPLGLSQAATIRVALAAGRGDLAGIRRAGWAALALGAAFMAVMAIIFFLGARHLVTLFLDADGADTPAVVALGVSYLFVAALFQVSDGIQVIAGGILRGLKDTRMPMIYGFLGYWVIGYTSGATLGLGLGMQGVGVWLGLLIGLSAAAGLAVFRFVRLCRALRGIFPEATASSST